MTHQPTPVQASDNLLDLVAVRPLLHTLDDQAEAVRVAAWRAVVRLPLTPDVWRELSRRMLELLSDRYRCEGDAAVASNGIPLDEAIDAAQFVPTRTVRERLQELGALPDFVSEPSNVWYGYRPSYGPEPDNLPDLRQQAVTQAAELMTQLLEEFPPNEYASLPSFSSHDAIYYLPSDQSTLLITVLYAALVRRVKAAVERNKAESTIRSVWEGLDFGNSIIAFINNLREPIVPDVPSLYASYLALQEFDPAPLRVIDQGEMSPDWRYLSWPLAWVVSRAGLRQIQADLTQFLLSPVEAERLAAARLIQEVTLYAVYISGPKFGGGDTPGDIAPIMELIDDVAPEPYHTTVGAAPDSSKTISAWIEERQSTPDKPLIIGDIYTLSIKVGGRVASNLFAGQDTDIEEAEIPEAGLLTQWTIVSDSVAFRSISPDVHVRAWPEEGLGFWLARFPLLVVRDRESDVVQLEIIPRQVDGSRLSALIDVGGDPWREFRIDLLVMPPNEALVAAAPPAVSIVDEMIITPASQLNLVPPHEWQTLPNELTIRPFSPSRLSIQGAVFDPDGKIDAQRGWIDILEDADWGGRPELTQSLILALRGSAEFFRGEHEDYLNNIDAAHLSERLDTLRDHSEWWPVYDWSSVPDACGASHQEKWLEVRDGLALRRLAREGFNLYECLFPSGKRIRTLIDLLVPGQRLNIFWTDATNGWVPHVPWSLLYCKNPQEPIDPLGFFGLRFRINYVKHWISSSRALGRPDQVYRAHCLFWGADLPDTTVDEAATQQQLWAAGAPYLVTAPLSGSPDPKNAVVQLLSTPTLQPMPLLYLFCHYSTSGDGNQQTLRFGSTNESSDVIQSWELPLGDLPDRPLIFTNACATVASDTYVVNGLEQYFFRRKARAFIGTETMVPIELASRFAAIFFRFFYREIDPEPIAAGEALAQARIFLWSHYRNIGGLLYSYINQYDLFMASPAEIDELRRRQ